MGDKSRENASKIGSCYYRLGKYKDAIPFLLKSWELGDIRKEKASILGECYFMTEDYANALSFFLESRKLGKKTKENESEILKRIDTIHKTPEKLKEDERILLKETFGKDFLTKKYFLNEYRVIS